MSESGERVLRILRADGGRELVLPRTGRLVIGRSRSCEVPVEDAAISRQHAALRLDDGVLLEDLGSANGTRLFSGSRAPTTPETGGTLESGVRTLAAREVVPLSPGTVFQLGTTLFVIEPRGRAVSSEVVSSDPAMRALYDQAERIAKSTISVLIVGETGVGKEHLAEHIVRASPRAERPFLRLNCAALSDTLLESELFGHERGAFTGATKTKPGLLESADSGTVFLDEIGEINASTQVKLLRVLESREVQRIGALQPRTVDVRFISATNRNLKAEVGRGAFREDLYFRLQGVELEIPALRERPSEIEPLAQSFARDAAKRSGISSSELRTEVLDALKRHRWRGNIRELRNVMERAVLFAGGARIGLEHLPDEIAHPGRPAPASDEAGSDLRDHVAELERAHVMSVLDECNGNQTLAAKRLGISRTTLATRLDAWGVPRPRKGR